MSRRSSLGRAAESQSRRSARFEWDLPRTVAAALARGRWRDETCSSAAVVKVEVEEELAKGCACNCEIEIASEKRSGAGVVGGNKGSFQRDKQKNGERKGSCVCLGFEGFKTQESSRMFRVLVEYLGRHVQ